MKKSANELLIREKKIAENGILSNDKTQVFARLKTTASYRRPLRSPDNVPQTVLYQRKVSDLACSITFLQLIPATMTDDEMLDTACKRLNELEDELGLKRADCLSYQSVAGYAGLDLDYLLNEDDRNLLCESYGEVNIDGFSCHLLPESIKTDRRFVEITGRKRPSKILILKVAKAFELKAKGCRLLAADKVENKYFAWIDI